MEKTEKKKKISVPVLIVNIVVTVLFLFVFGCLLTVMIQSFSGKEPTLFGYRSFVVVTDSMTGTYDKGDVIIVKVIDSEDLAKDPSEILKEGDVITFIAPEGFGAVEGYTVTHRIVTAPYEGEDGVTYVRTKGDAAAAADETPVPVNNVTGKVLGKSEALAGLQSVLRSKTGFLLVIVVPLLLIALWQIVVFAVASAKNKRSQEAENSAVDGDGTAENDDPAHNADTGKIEEIKRKALEEYLKNSKEKGGDKPQDKDR